MFPIPLRHASARLPPSRARLCPRGHPKKAAVTPAEAFKPPPRGREAMDILFEISRALNTGLDRETLAILVSLCEVCY